MIYCMQVFTNEENFVIKRLKELAKDDGALIDCYTPIKEEKKKYKGKWHIEKKILFPGYIFIETDNIEKIYGYLFNIPSMTKLLGIDKKNKYISYLFPDEEKFLKRLMSEENHIVELSSVEVLDNKTIRVIDGPLKGFEGLVVKTDLHKRQVKVLVELLGQKVEATLGIDIVEVDDKEKD